MQGLAPELSRDEVKKRWLSLGLVVVGIVALSLGAQGLIAQAIVIARKVGLSERVIGLTFVAMGTSLPELATSVMAALKKETDIAVGNIIGSNIFNVLLIPGAVASIAPLGFDRSLLSFDVWFLMALTVIMMLLIMTQKRLARWEGGVLLLGAAGYTVKLFF